MLALILSGVCKNRVVIVVGIGVGTKDWIYKTLAQWNIELIGRIDKLHFHKLSYRLSYG